jgi:hypothetical protein
VPASASTPTGRRNLSGVPHVHLVLDTSAIVAYARSVGVGETIEQVEENSAQFALPVACLVEASARVDAELLAGLVAHPAAVVVDLTGADWAVLAVTRELLGGLDVASALHAAERHGCDILTGEPGRYAALGDDPPIIVLG